MTASTIAHGEACPVSIAGWFSPATVGTVDVLPTGSMELAGLTSARAPRTTLPVAKLVAGAALLQEIVR
jgi:hypothetical protein